MSDGNVALITPVENLYTTNSLSGELVMPNLQRDQAVPAKLLAFEYVKSTDFFPGKAETF